MHKHIEDAKSDVSQVWAEEKHHNRAIQDPINNDKDQPARLILLFITRKYVTCSKHGVCQTNIHMRKRT